MAQPARIVVDLPDTSVSTLDTQKPTQALFARSGYPNFSLG